MNKLDCWIKLRMEGPYWKWSLVIEIAKLLGVKITYYSGGSL